MGFTEKLRTRWESANSLVCVGLDPDPAKFPDAFVDDEDALFLFCRDIVDATAEFACAFKPQIAYFAAHNGGEAALQRAGIEPAAVGYLNLHGTSTPANDSIEASVVAALFPPGLHASSTKGWTGHTLGAAGIVESVFALLALSDGLLPGTLNSEIPDPACGPQIRFDNAQADIRYAMNNSFGFGGNNCALVFGKAG